MQLALIRGCHLHWRHRPCSSPDRIAATSSSNSVGETRGRRSFLPPFFPSFSAATNEEAVKGEKRPSAGSKRAMHSLRHRDVTRPSRRRQVVSCSSRSDGSKEPSEPTKEVKSLIWRTKLARCLFFSFFRFPSRNLSAFPAAGWRSGLASPKTQSHAAGMQRIAARASSYDKRVYKVG